MSARRRRGRTVEIRTAEGAITVPMAWYIRRLKSLAAPEFPIPDEKGEVPATPYLRASIARELLRRRIEIEATKRKLARAAGTSERLIAQVESGVRSADPQWMRKIETVLKRWRSRTAQ